MDAPYTRPVMEPLLRGQTLCKKKGGGAEGSLSFRHLLYLSTARSSLRIVSLQSKVFELLLPLTPSTLLN